MHRRVSPIPHPKTRPPLATPVHRCDSFDTVLHGQVPEQKGSLPKPRNCGTSGLASAYPALPGTMLRSRALAACTVLALLACSGCQASATNVIVTKDDRALFPIAAPFVFGPNGHIDMTLKDLQPYHRTGKDVPDPNVARMGFFMTTSEAQAHDLSRVSPPHPVGIKTRP